MLNFLWVVYGIYFKKILYQTTQAIFAGKWLYEGMELPTKTSGLPLNTEIIKKTHKIMMEDQKDVLVGE